MAQKWLGPHRYRQAPSCRICIFACLDKKSACGLQCSVTDSGWLMNEQECCLWCRAVSVGNKGLCKYFSGTLIPVKNVPCLRHVTLIGIGPPDSEWHITSWARNDLLRGTRTPQYEQLWCSSTRAQQEASWQLTPGPDLRTASLAFPLRSVRYQALFRRGCAQVVKLEYCFLECRHPPSKHATSQSTAYSNTHCFLRQASRIEDTDQTQRFFHCPSNCQRRWFSCQ